MKEIKINNSYICYKEFNSSKTKILEEYINSKTFKDFVNNCKENLIFVLWWDWTMLKAIKKHHKRNLAFLWVNFWNKGFLLNPKELIKKDAKYIIKEHPLIEVSNKKWDSHIAVNEIDISSKNWRIVNLDINMSSKQNFELNSDWIIISSTLGSTWYNSSLYGPIVLSKLDAFIITVKAPRKPRLFPSIVLSNSEEIIISNIWRKNPVSVFWDWEEIFKSDKEKINFIIKKSKYQLKLAIMQEYLNTWDNKAFEL